MSPRVLLPRAALIILALVGVALSGCGEQPQQAGSGGQQPPPPEVSVVTLQPQTVTLSRELPGRVHASLVAEVRPQVTGIVRERLFEEGGFVKAGAPLYQLEDNSYRAEVRRAEASLARARASLESARLKAGRTAELVKSRVVSQQDYDDAQAALSEAQADMLVAEAALSSARVNLDYTLITSPISGHVGKSSVTRGALVTANQSQALATVRQLDPLYVDLSQPSSEMLQLRRALADGSIKKVEDLPVSLLLEDGSRYEHAGTLAFSEVSVEPSTGSYSLRVVVPNPDHVLMPGMYVRAEMATGVREQALLVPQQAVQRDHKGKTSVMLVGAENTIEARPISVSRTVKDQWLVEAGLNAGERVVIEGLQKIRSGAQVRVAGTDAE